MSETMRIKGHCLCGAVRIEADTAEVTMGACHYGMCRRWGGGPLLALSCGSTVTFEGSSAITAYASSDWVERGF